MSEKVALLENAAGSNLENLEIHTWYTWVQVDGLPALPTSTSGHQTRNGLFGSREQVIEELVKEREENGVSYVTVTSSALDAFAPIVARLSS
jgi:hypothetical protein